MSTIVIVMILESQRFDNNGDFLTTIFNLFQFFKYVFIIWAILSLVSLMIAGTKLSEYKGMNIFCSIVNISYAAIVVYLLCTGSESDWWFYALLFVHIYFSALFTRRVWKYLKVQQANTILS